MHCSPLLGGLPRRRKKALRHSCTVIGSHTNSRYDEAPSAGRSVQRVSKSLLAQVMTYTESWTVKTFPKIIIVVVVVVVVVVALLGDALPDLSHTRLQSAVPYASALFVSRVNDKGSTTTL